MSLTFDDVEPTAAALRSIYAAAFTPPPWHETPDQIEGFVRRLPQLAGKPGFRCVIARVDGEPAGFTCGFACPDPWPADRLYGHIADALGERLPILTGRSELHELAVDPRFTRRGVGAALVERFTAAGPSWLVTSPEADAAVRLYERLGWSQACEFEVPRERLRIFRVYLSPASPGACVAP
ncbi:ribosomal protein S18 acetylase RimI-like enzyme [Streptosporangium becharense]|uniref:Ribosomal protein S18 acetylase RimI-like enzyme n=1 Tax=Streptosporangium becharense TaxID=1816182 RepID=A0A7W9MI05_9ACTN|nr:GNAT family N-acetyltransferase [Streptosporangium becharense]MBB2913436.1 ribosomal protein S18 acetylase RimI-like enzyme [Streptosporangium becharense]MBB5821126.1 ribosomal protein S18 acetylase RimI-like enzyme [Streptosporangium becharense]